MPEQDDVPPHAATEAMRAAVARATNSAWRLDRLTVGGGVVDLDLATPGGPLLASIARGGAGRKALHVVGDLAVWYRSGARPPAEASLRGLPVLAARLRASLVALLDDAPPEPSVARETREAPAAPEPAPARAPAAVRATPEASQHGASFDAEAEARRFWTEGYVAIDGFFPRDVALAGHAWLESAGPDAPPWTPAEHGALLQTDLDVSIILCDAFSAPVRRLHEDARLRALTGAILGHDYADLYGMMMRFKARGVGGPWHQDCASEPDTPYCVNRIIYPHDAGGAVGGDLGVVPGSHRVGPIPPGEPHGALPGERWITPRAGTLVLMHASTFHRISPVTSDQPRYSINLRAAPAGTGAAVTSVAVYRNVKCLFAEHQVVPRG